VKKIVICTTPIRPYPTDFPPFGSMAIIQSIRRHLQADVNFYNIDYHRPSLAEVRKYFEDTQCDVLGISAVVSTAYAYVKKLTAIVKSVSPKTIIVVGGNLAASAEILHRKCGVDYCVIGDGEKIIVDLLSHLWPAEDGCTDVHGVQGITFLKDGEFHFTGYGARPAADEIADPDYGILQEDDSFDYFVSPRVAERLFAYEDKVEIGKRVATVVMTKGCVARCTFCHRWEKGFRTLRTHQLEAHIRDLVEHHNVGFIQVADENFGSDKQAAVAIADMLGSMGLYWQVAGVRTSTVTREALSHWKANGCLSVYYGIESGSQKMLDVMEKKTTVEQNINALKWTGEVGLNTIIQLIIGMPGENDQTIEETFEFLKTVAPHIRQWEGKTASDLISINYAQALPGTPLYEYGREAGLIGKDIDGEERYLLAISDTDAYKDDHFVNMTDQPMLKVLSWRKILQARLDHFHYRSMTVGDIGMGVGHIIGYFFGVFLNRMRKKMFFVRNAQFAGELKRDFVRDSGYFNVNSGLKFTPLLLNRRTAHLLFPAVASYIVAGQLVKRPAFAVRIVAEYFGVQFGWRRPKVASPAHSLRKIVRIATVADQAGAGSAEMLELRRGR
jgi:anaerobic magnesium-protoporphyrin IX monomethyl ester cyclase